ncbi:hypothetical protein NDU88_001144 [Pleurodeles waltl]|uniref:Uncharacterized protein n=1 Tax=Pleurodeles waltl TaxID=8319 RepID=A0AAV7NA40_PLEWA|nr:hypothetical protein NDU88_001144 [Pleurodeles waltl]
MIVQLFPCFSRVIPGWVAWVEDAYLPSSLRFTWGSIALVIMGCAPGGVVGPGFPSGSPQDLEVAIGRIVLEGANCGCPAAAVPGNARELEANGERVSLVALQATPRPGCFCGVQGRTLSDSHLRLPRSHFARLGRGAHAQAACLQLLMVPAAFQWPSAWAPSPGVAQELLLLLGGGDGSWKALPNECAQLRLLGGQVVEAAVAVELTVSAVRLRYAWIAGSLVRCSQDLPSASGLRLQLERWSTVAACGPVLCSSVPFCGYGVPIECLMVTLDVLGEETDCDLLPKVRKSC